jgi:hypothetical protein
MVTPPDCPQENRDLHKLIREGSSQDQRRPAALDPAYAPVDGRTPAHGMVFAERYAALLKYFSATNQAAGDWTPFFSEDLSVRLAAVAIEDVDAYKLRIKFSADFLNDHDRQLASEELKDHLGFLYGSLGTLARQLDVLKDGLPVEIALKGILQNLIRSQLAPAFTRLIAYYKAGIRLALVNAVLPSPQLLILRAPVVDLTTVLSAGLSADWSKGGEWPAFVDAVEEDAAVYGDSAASVFVRINHCATHGLFKSVFEQFLKVFARTVSEAVSALNDTLTGWDRHEPHYALFLSFLRLLELVRADINTLTGRHLDFYYRQILLLKEKAAEPGHVHLLVELARQVSSHELQAGQLFKAGKDDTGRDAFFASDRGLVVNRAKLAALKTLYRHRHGPEQVAAPAVVNHAGRLFASPMADSNDGLGAPLASAEESWHPFFNKIYADGELKEVRMPQAEVGFAIASHYLLMAGGQRTITLDFTLANDLTGFPDDQAGEVICLLTTVKGWQEVSLKNFKSEGEGSKLRLLAELSGEFPAITPYVGKIHGHGFATTLPMLLVKLRHDDRAYIYSQLQDVVLKQIDLQVKVSELRTLPVSNDFGPVDTAKPFQPFGASPVAGSSLIVGSVEAFQKKLSDVSLKVEWLAAPAVFPDGDPLPEVTISFLKNGSWEPPQIAADAVSVTAEEFSLTPKVDLAFLDAPDFAADEFYGTTSRHGFAKLLLSGGFGLDAYQAALIAYLRDVADAPDIGDAAEPPKAPVGPTMTHLSMSYTASASLMVAAGAQAQFFHLTPFGHTEKHLNTNAPVHLLPRFDFQYDNQTQLSEAEFYIGVQGLAPPQNLALLFEVADGTANPRVKKPERSPLVFWSYLSNNEWIAFAEDEVQDGSGELLNSGVVSFALPRQATDSNTLLPAGMFWIRAAVKEKSDAVCRLRLVAAQALAATFIDHGNSARFAASTLAAETISKLAQPDSAVKSVRQPFPSFGGRAAELPAAFHTRISERLRHKDRAIGLWDYERLVLEAFPEIYKVKCLDHTQYEPSDSGEGIYRELAPGHVTIVTIPELRFNHSRDRLRPYTSLGLLEKIAAFLQKRLSCFARLHVKNPEFEEVFVDFRVRLRAGFDETYYVNQLRQAITAFLSPWAFEGGGSPSFGGRMYKSVLINFVEEQASVDYVTDFKLFHKTIDDGRAVSTEKDEVLGSKALSVLVSVPADKHRVVAIKAAAESPTNAGCRCDS